MIATLREDTFFPLNAKGTEVHLSLGEIDYSSLFATIGNERMLQTNLCITKGETPDDLYFLNELAKLVEECSYVIIVNFTYKYNVKGKAYILSSNEFSIKKRILEAPETGDVVRGMFSELVQKMAEEAGIPVIIADLIDDDEKKYYFSTPLEHHQALKAVKAELSGFVW